MGHCVTEMSQDLFINAVVYSFWLIFGGLWHKPENMSMNKIIVLSYWKKHYPISIKDSVKNVSHILLNTNLQHLITRPSINYSHMWVFQNNISLQSLRENNHAVCHQCNNIGQRCKMFYILQEDLPLITFTINIMQCCGFKIQLFDTEHHVH